MVDLISFPTVFARAPRWVGNSAEKAWPAFTDTFQGPLLLSAQGMRKRPCRGRPVRCGIARRRPPAGGRSGSWRTSDLVSVWCSALLVCDFQGTKEPFQAPSGGKFQEDLLHELQVLTSQAGRQPAEECCLPGGHPLAVQVIPVRYSDTAAVPAADRLR